MSKSEVVVAVPSGAKSKSVVVDSSKLMSAVDLVAAVSPALAGELATLVYEKAQRDETPRRIGAAGGRSTWRERQAERAALLEFARTARAAEPSPSTREVARRWRDSQVRQLQKELKELRGELDSSLKSEAELLTKKLVALKSSKAVDRFVQQIKRLDAQSRPEARANRELREAWTQHLKRNAPHLLRDK